VEWPSAGETVEAAWKNLRLRGASQQSVRAPGHRSVRGVQKSDIAVARCARPLRLAAWQQVHAKKL
jgi:hypothetical protein